MNEQQSLLDESPRWVDDRCPTCGSRHKTYKRSLNSAMAKSLVTMYGISRGDTERHVHVSDIWRAASQVGESGLAKLRYWELIREARGRKGFGGKTSGYWKITEDGCSFARDELSVRKFVLVRNGDLIGFSGPFISIRHAIRDRFDYEALMQQSA